MTLLDAYAVVALLADEPAAPEVEALLHEGDARIVVLNLAEAIEVCVRVHGLALGEVHRVLEPLLMLGTLGTERSEIADGWAAAELRGRYYSRRGRALSIADCFLLAHAARSADGVATADPAVAEVARAEGVRVVALPGSTGSRP